MIVYATEFPTKTGTSIEQFLVVAARWLSGSQWYPFSDLDKIVFPDDEIVDLSRPGHDLHVAGFSESGGRRVGIRHAYTELNKFRWETDVVASEDTSGLWVCVNVFCEVLNLGETPPVPKKPYLIKQLLKELGGGDDCGLQVKDTPISLRVEQLDIAADIVTGRLRNVLPVAYVSLDFGNYPTLDVEALARRLGGLAHVVVEPHRHFSVELARRAGSVNPWGGAVGLCWPGSQGRRAKYLPRFYASSWEMIDDIERGVRTGLLFLRSRRNNLWSYLKEGISARRIIRLREQGSRSVDDWMTAFDQENEALRERAQRAESRNAHLEETVRVLQERESARADVSFLAGAEQELFPGEVKDAIVRTLQEDLGNFTTGSRRETLVSDFVAANPPSDVYDRLETAIKDCLSRTDRVGYEEIKQLNELGFTITDDGKHYKVIFENDPRLTFALFKTASDHRSGKNIASDIIKKITKR